MTRRRTLGFYAEHPRVFEQHRAEWDDRELERHLREQERGMRDDYPRVGGFRLVSDAPSSALASNQPSEEADSNG